MTLRRSFSFCFLARKGCVPVLLQTDLRRKHSSQTATDTLHCSVFHRLSTHMPAPSFPVIRNNGAIIASCTLFVKKKQRIKVAFFPYRRCFPAYSFSHSFNHNALSASEGIRQSPRGLNAMEPIFTPSGMQLRLNCCVKNRR